MENTSNPTVMTHTGSATSMSIADALALSPTNRLTPAERKARNHVRYANDRRLALVPSADQENAQVGDALGEMTLIGAKRSCSHNTSAVTIIRPLIKNLGLGRASGMGMALVEKRNKNSQAAGKHAQRVVLGPLRSNESPIKEDKELSTAVTDDSACSFLELDEIEDTETPLADEFVVANGEEEEDDPFGGLPGGFVWDVANPFTTPPNAILQQYVEAMRLSETIGPMDAAPVASLSCNTTNFEASPEEEIPALCSDDSFDDILRPVERAYLDFLIAQDEAEEQLMERRRQKRAAMRSRNKMLDVLGVEARQAVDAAAQYA